jgi:hypothetical protein
MDIMAISTGFVPLLFALLLAWPAILEAPERSPSYYLILAAL